jgi:hypothetical protein
MLFPSQLVVSTPEKIPNDKEDYVERESTRLQEQ